jgi:RNA polymerase sigma-70 factor (ECF subfamily)
LTSSDSSFLAEVYERVGASLFRLALSITGEPASAEDAVQEAFVRVWRRRACLSEPARLDGYLHRAARNAALDQVRRGKSREKLAEGAALLVRPVGADADGPDPERIAAALMKLPLEQREVVLLRVYDGLPFKEVAARVGAPEGTVHSRYRYAMERLRALLEVRND